MKSTKTALQRLVETANFHSGVFRKFFSNFKAFVLVNELPKQIVLDPKIKALLNDLSLRDQDDYLRNPEIVEKVQTLVDVGIIKIRSGHSQGFLFVQNLRFFRPKTGREPKISARTDERTDENRNRK